MYEFIYNYVQFTIFSYSHIKSINYLQIKKLQGISVHVKGSSQSSSMNRSYRVLQKSCPFLHNDTLYKNRQVFFDIQKVIN